MLEHFLNFFPLLLLLLLDFPFQWKIDTWNQQIGMHLLNNANSFSSGAT